MSHCAACHALISSPQTPVCGVCRVTAYCGDACADAHWAVHHLGVHCQNDKDDIVNLVLPHVWVGGIEALADAKFMERISAVVSAVPVEDAAEEARMRAGRDEEHHIFVPIHDSPDAPIEEYWDRAAAFIDKHVRKGKDVLVHCHAGMSRSVTLVIHYMMRYLGYASADEALETIKRKRCIAHPNKGFMKKLKEIPLPAPLVGDKFGEVMGEFYAHRLHSGSTRGRLVTDPRQAKAIAYSESRQRGGRRGNRRGKH
jgi:protein-tyrosine phosphatase